MPDPGAVPAYRPIADHLPAVYQEDAVSLEQVRGYTGLLDVWHRAFLAQLEDLTTWLSPEARAVQPPGLAPTASAALVYDACRAVFDELAAWFGFTFPESWRAVDRELELDRKRHFLLRVARLWRRKGTPRGFLAWFCRYFRLATRPERPILLEHFKYRPDGDSAGTNPDDPDDYAHRVTLLIPLTPAFADYRRRREVVDFVNRHAPAHLLMRVCWVTAGYSLDVSNVAAVRAVLEQLRSFTPLDDGIHLVTPPMSGRPIDHLNTGRLPGGGTE